jgi:hypothetical protein
MCIFTNDILQPVAVAVSLPREASDGDTGLVVRSVHTKHLLFSLLLYHFSSYQKLRCTNNMSLHGVYVY